MELVREFLSGSLSAVGAVVEAQPAGELYVLLPPRVAADLGLPEELWIAAAEAPAEDRASVDGRLGSALLERLVSQRLAAPTVAAVVVPPELPRPLPAHLPVLHNAVRAGEAEPTRAVERYLVADVRLVLQSDEVRSVMETVCVRLSDGALVTPLPLGAAEPRRLRALDDAERRHVLEGLRRSLECQAPVRLAGALTAVQRRVRRDLERLAEYYASLDAEMARAARRARQPEERARRTAKRAALADDLAARRHQVRERARVRLAASMVAATLVETDVERFELGVRRRNRAGQVVVRGRSADSVFEGPACAVCREAVLRFYLCDEELHPLCLRCGHEGRLDATRCGGCRPPAADVPRLVVEDPTASLRVGVVQPAAEGDRGRAGGAHC